MSNVAGDVPTLGKAYFRNWTLEITVPLGLFGALFLAVSATTVATECRLDVRIAWPSLRTSPHCSQRGVAATKNEARD